jgi:hypothetical protein
LHTLPWCTLLYGGTGAKQPTAITAMLRLHTWAGSVARI